MIRSMVLLLSRSRSSVLLSEELLPPTLYRLPHESQRPFYFLLTVFAIPDRIGTRTGAGRERHGIYPRQVHSDSDQVYCLVRHRPHHEPVPGLLPRCIYCDSRSACYGIEDFGRVRAKENALALLRDELRRKVRPGIVGMGSMSDPYNPFEGELQLTRHALELLDATASGRPSPPRETGLPGT